MSWRVGRSQPRDLGDIARDLAESDPRLEKLFLSFNERACGGKMPRMEKIRAKPHALIAWIGRRVRPAPADLQSMAGWWM
jgi:hypothetical protein